MRRFIRFFRRTNFQQTHEQSLVKFKMVILFVIKTANVMHKLKLTNKLHTCIIKNSIKKCLLDQNCRKINSLITTTTNFLCTSYAKVFIWFRTDSFCIRYEFISFTHITSCKFMFCYHSFHLADILVWLITEQLMVSWHYVCWFCTNSWKKWLVSSKSYVTKKNL